MVTANATPVHNTMPSKVIVHPLVLLSVVDHYHRVAMDTKKRVVGVLLGSKQGNELDISNSFAIPFEEDEKQPSVWYLDHNYLENMAGMFRKVNAKEKVIGWYHTGPRIRQNDIDIHNIIRRFCPNPCLVIIDAQPRQLGLPSDAYFVVQDLHEDGTPTSMTFEHVASAIGAEEAEEIGVEHLLRDIKDSSVGTLATRITQQLSALRGLHTKLESIYSYTLKVSKGDMPVNNEIVALLQNVFNLLPDLNVESLLNAFCVTTNDQMLTIYLASMIRSILALHDLINNKIANHEEEQSGLKDLTDNKDIAKKILSAEGGIKPDTDVVTKNSA